MIFCLYYRSKQHQCVLRLQACRDTTQGGSLGMKGDAATKVDESCMHYIALFYHVQPFSLSMPCLSLPVLVIIPIIILFSHYKCFLNTPLLIFCNLARCVYNTWWIGWPVFIRKIVNTRTHTSVCHRQYTKTIIWRWVSIHRIPTQVMVARRVAARHPPALT